MRIADYVEPEPTFELCEVRVFVVAIKSALAKGQMAYADDLLDELQNRINEVIGGESVGIKKEASSKVL